MKPLKWGWVESLVMLRLKMTVMIENDEWKLLLIQSLLCQPDLYCMHLSEDELCSSGVAITYPIKICLNRASMAKTKLWSALSALLRQRWWVFTRAHTHAHTRTHTNTPVNAAAQTLFSSKGNGSQKVEIGYRKRVWFFFIWFFFFNFLTLLKITFFFLHLGELVLLFFWIIFCEVAKRELTKHRYCSHKNENWLLVITCV